MNKKRVRQERRGKEGGDGGSAKGKLKKNCTVYKLLNQKSGQIPTIINPLQVQKGFRPPLKSSYMNHVTISNNPPPFFYVRKVKEMLTKLTCHA